MNWEQGISPSETAPTLHTSQHNSSYYGASAGEVMHWGHLPTDEGAPHRGSTKAPYHGSVRCPIHGRPRRPIHGRPRRPIHGSPDRPMNGVLPRAKKTCLASPPRRLKWACPTLQGQNVYVSCPRRIRFTRDTYTFRPSRVYVVGKRPCPLSPRDACEDGDKAEESRGKRVVTKTQRTRSTKSGEASSTNHLLSDTRP